MIVEYEIFVERYYLIGVVSFGYRCAVPGFPGSLTFNIHCSFIFYALKNISGVYSRVTEYDEWIRNTIANDDLK